MCPSESSLSSSNSNSQNYCSSCDSIILACTSSSLWWQSQLFGEQLWLWRCCRELSKKLHSTRSRISSSSNIHEQAGLCNIIMKSILLWQKLLPNRQSRKKVDGFLSLLLDRNVLTLSEHVVLPLSKMVSRHVSSFYLSSLIPWSVQSVGLR